MSSKKTRTPRTSWALPKPFRVTHVSSCKYLQILQLILQLRWRGDYPDNPPPPQTEFLYPPLNTISPFPPTPQKVNFSPIKCVKPVKHPSGLEQLPSIAPALQAHVPTTVPKPPSEIVLLPSRPSIAPAVQAHVTTPHRKPVKATVQAQAAAAAAGCSTAESTPTAYLYQPQSPMTKTVEASVNRAMQQTGQEHTIVAAMTIVQQTISEAQRQGSTVQSVARIASRASKAVLKFDSGRVTRSTAELHRKKNITPLRALLNCTQQY